MKTEPHKTADESPLEGSDPRGRRGRLTAVAWTVAVSGLAGLALILIARSGSQPALRTALLNGVCWTLVVGGVSGTCLASAGVRSGWLIMLGMQPMWIAYAVVTGQLGFVLGSVAYAAGQLNGYLRASPAAKTARIASVIARTSDFA